MGCKNGGFPYCPRPNNNYCKDGTHLVRSVYLDYKLKGGEGCVCKDGIMPKCKDTNDYVKCPDGSDIDWRNFSVYARLGFMGCKEEEFNVNDIIPSS